MSAGDGHTRLHDDPRSTRELVAAALDAPDEDQEWRAIGALHLRGTRQVFTAARRLTESDVPKERRVGADILGQIGWSAGRVDWPARRFQEESVTLLLGMLERETDIELLGAICTALGHRSDPRAIVPIARLKDHPDARVRFAVAFGLLGHEDETAIRTLIELSRDADEGVRDWATFGLGSQIDADTPAIREALYERLLRDGGEIQGEAMVGLARRKDARVFDTLLAALEADAEVGLSGTLPLEAAAELADTRLYPVLLRLRENWRDDRSWVLAELEGAMEQCRPPA